MIVKELQKFQALLRGALKEKLVTDTLSGLSKILTPVKSLIGTADVTFDVWALIEYREKNAK